MTPESSREPLAPCPACDSVRVRSVVVRVAANGRPRPRWAYACDDCGLRSPHCTFEENAREAWTALPRRAQSSRERRLEEALERIAKSHAHKPECGPRLGGTIFGCSEWCPVDIATAALTDSPGEAMTTKEPVHAND